MRMECGQKDKSDGIRRETGLKPLNDFRLKAGLRREGSPTQGPPRRSTGFSRKPVRAFRPGYTEAGHCAA